MLSQNELAVAKARLDQAKAEYDKFIYQLLILKRIFRNY
jgi:hypothetical protein